MSFFDDDDHVPPPTRPESSNNGGGYNQGNRDGGHRSGGYNGGGQSQGGQRSGGQKFERKPEEPGYVYLPYVVTGMKDVPADVIERIGRYITKLNGMQYTLRSGGATEMENAIERFSTPKFFELHIPFKDFEQKQSKFAWTGTFVRDVAGQFHSNWDAVAKAQVFFAKNIKLLAGGNGKSRAMFAIIWTEDGAERREEVKTYHGQLGHFINAACGYRIPVFNFGRADAEERLQRFLTQTY